MGEELHCFGDAFCAGVWDVDAMTLVVVRCGSKVPSVNTVGGVGAAVFGCFVY